HVGPRLYARSYADDVSGDFDGDDPQARQDGVSDLAERGRLSSDVQVNRGSRQRPGDEPEPTQPHVEPRKDDVQGSEDRNAQVDPERDRPCEGPEGGTCSLGDSRKAVDEPQQAENGDQGGHDGDCG